MLNAACVLRFINTNIRVLPLEPVKDIAVVLQDVIRQNHLVVEIHQAAIFHR